MPVYDGGATCGNVSARVELFISRYRYELISLAPTTGSSAPSEAPKTP